MKNTLRITAALLACLMVILLAPDVSAEEKSGIITATLVAEMDYDEIKPFFGGFAAVRKNGKWGAVDKQGKLAVGFKYGAIRGFSDDGYAAACDGEPGFGGKWGLIDTKGKTVVPLIYDDFFDSRKGPTAFKKNRKWGYIGNDGKAVTPFIYELAYSFNEGYASVKKDGKWGLISADGKLAVECIYAEITNCLPDELIAVNKGTEKKPSWGFIDRSGKTVIPFIYDHAIPFTDGLAAVRKDGKAGYIDKSGKTVIPFIYDSAAPFSEGLAYVSINADLKKEMTHRHIIIDKTGKIVFELDLSETVFSGTVIPTSKGLLTVNHQYISVGSFENDRINISLNDRYALVDREGKFIIPYGKYSRISSVEGKVAPACRDSFEGLIDINGNEIIPIEYDAVSVCLEEMVTASRDGKCYIFAIEEK